MKTRTPTRSRPATSREPSREEGQPELTVITEGKGTRIVTFVSEFKGSQYFNIRKQYRKEGGDWLFSKDGIAVPLERPNLVKISRALKAAAADME